MKKLIYSLGLSALAIPAAFAQDGGAASAGTDLVTEVTATVTSVGVAALGIFAVLQVIRHVKRAFSAGK
jgi:hypothetical protein